MVSRSSGCLLCVQRRVKVGASPSLLPPDLVVQALTASQFQCDERHPGCLRCETYGQTCPGYWRGFKFVAGKPYRSRRQPKVSNLQADRQRDADSTTDSNSSNQETSAIERVQQYSLGVGNLNVLQCLDILTYEISQPFASSSGYVVSRWLTFLPGMYGQNKTLDATVRTFVAHHIGSITRNQEAVRYARCSYQEALRKLRHSLNHRSECLSSEIYCSVLLLCLYELFANPLEGDSWIKHAKGLSQLTEARGPSRYKTELDNVLLKSSRGLIVMYALFGGEKCILTSDEWHTVMRQQYNPGLSSGLDTLVEQFFAYFTRSPALIHKLFDLREADITNPATLMKVSEILTEALDMQNKLSVWYDEFSCTVPIPQEIISSTDDPVYPIVFSYSDVNSATIFCGYYSYMVLIHEILKTCGYPGEHAAVVVFFRDQICKSVEYTAQGLLGPYRMGFPLRVAYEVADPVTRAWIDECLKRFSTFYAILHPGAF
ncbi:hypothetical protein P175DRAFT_0535587 [Aspergillus ochraceoroseus IBT 24754]|uniref:C6 finger domain protein n=3 Tax=Aspergillus subgen. Nidulantes TaxID=2720870 RepID=A0A0F8V4G6_9EURO|nr:uncharacterized protein P175DRAFT_0535587 [Aspergillus ochraceoroseus IBT 24754]KKK16294.1 hypothetical protein AOCH_001379 [Aspergillus ochraceoroseus]KKK26659.1 hypothetical protein ARAM_002545 [Aspergillus rambellii]PTU17844.1 hypothetical protein P175DRAFT_0535587 [Aspergillus ochraceoroseus IBT 24754]